MPASGDVPRLRKRLNLLLLLLPQQWITLVVMYWLQRLMRPADLMWALPPAAVLAGAAALSVVPAFLPPAYFRPRGFERRLYPRLGIRWFRRFAPDGTWVNARLRRLDAGYRVVRDAETRARHLAGSIRNERWHLSWLLFGLVTQAAAMDRGQTTWAALLTIFNIVFNLYPVMHQRHVRSPARRLTAPSR